MIKLAMRTAAAAAVVLLSGAAFAATTLSINTALTTTDPLYKGLETFRDSVNKRTNGAIEVKLFPNSPGYRLILNNILFPAAKKKKLKT